MIDHGAGCDTRLAFERCLPFGVETPLWGLLVGQLTKDVFIKQLDSNEDRSIES